jgi:hypothetical protein
VATNLSAYNEMTIDTGAVSAELATGGVRVNYIPKDGGNRVAGTFVVGFGNGGDAGRQLLGHVEGRGTRDAECAEAQLRLQPGLGGPIMRDRLWFHVAYKNQSTEAYPAGIFANSNANNPALDVCGRSNVSSVHTVDGSDLHFA